MAASIGTESKKEWCIKQVTASFFAAKDEQVTALDQFNTFVNTICPSLDLKIPSKCTALFALLKTAIVVVSKSPNDICYFDV